MGLITLPTQDLSNAPAQPFIALTGTSDVIGLPSGWPQSRNAFVRFWCGNLAYTPDFIANYANKKLAYRLAAAEWAEIATATPPQKYTLPLADGWVRVNAAEYWKTQEGIVIVTFRVARENGAEINTSTQIIATLPEGFRPPSDVTPHIAVSTMVVGSGGDRDAVAWVNSSGNIYAQASSQIPAKDGGTPVNWGGFAGTFVFSSGS